MIDFETMEEERLLNSFSKHQKVLAVALATLFIGSESASSEVAEPLTFATAFAAYKTQLNSAKASPDTILELATLSYELGRKKYGERHLTSYLLRQNLAHAYLDAGEFQLAASHYKSILDYYENTLGDDSQSYYFALLDIINLLKIARKLDGLEPKDLSLSVFSDHLAVDRLIEITPDIIAMMPESAMLFRAQTVKTAVSNSLLIKPSLIKKFAEKQLKESLKVYGEMSASTAEARFFLSKIYSHEGKSGKAIEQLEQVVQEFEDAPDYSNPFTLASHARLVVLFQEQGEYDLATQHCRAVGCLRPWDNNKEQTPLFRINPMYPPAMLKARKDGWVKVRYDIAEDGFAENVKVITSSDSHFEEPAAVAIGKWRFAPKTIDGNAVIAKGLEVILQFKLDAR